MKVIHQQRRKGRVVPKAESKWEEMVAREKVENVKMVEVPFLCAHGLQSGA